jgi:hypothetical protein
MSYGLQTCNSSIVAPARRVNSICIYVFVFSSLPLGTPLPRADTDLMLPLVHLRAHILLNNKHHVSKEHAASIFRLKEYVKHTGMYMEGEGW